MPVGGESGEGDGGSAAGDRGGGAGTNAGAAGDAGGGAGDAGSAGEPATPECGTVAASDDHYVDVAHGTDDPAHGSGPGACAFKSIAYARGLALGVMHVAAGTYETAEVFPILLGGSQSLICESSASLIRMKASPDTTLVMMLGEDNVIKNCSLDMGSFPGSAVDIESAGTHLLQNVHFTGGGRGATVGALVGSAEFVDCSFTGNSYGIYWENASYGSMSGNTFSSNASASVRCLTTNGTVTGSNNTLESCVTCTGCPFD